MSNFWKQLSTPFFVLAPMEDVTDVVFREVITLLPKPDVFFTEFTNVDGIFSRGGDVVKRRFEYTKNQHPIVAQVWGANPENFFKAAQLVEALGFDGIDINMGCPIENVMKKGAGAGLIVDHDKTAEIIRATKEGAKTIPVSVKTRLGIDEFITEEWIHFLLTQNLDAITIHGRTASQMSLVDANWEEIGSAVKIKNKVSPETIIIGNGDIKSYEQGVLMCNTHGVNGIMIGRGIFSDPWVFEKTTHKKIHSREEYIKLLLYHLKLFDEIWGKSKNFDGLKKFFKMYIKDFEGASELRKKLMICKNREEIEAKLKEEM